MMEASTRYALLAGAGLFLLAMAMAAWILMRDMRVQERYGWRIRQIHGEARLNAMRVMLQAVPYQDRSEDVDFVPDPEVVIPGAHELALMEAERIRSGRFTG